MVDSGWRGRTGKAAICTLAVIFVLSLTTWILGIVTTVDIARAEPYTTTKNTPSDATIYFYAAAFPMALTLASGIEMVLYFTGHLYPVASIVWSIIAFAVWIYQLLMWGTCERSADDSGDSCPHFYGYKGGYLGPNWKEGVWQARLALGGLLAILALVYMSIASRAVDLERKSKKSASHKLSTAS